MDIVDQIKWMLIGMLACIVGACTDVDHSRTGASASYEAPTPLIAAARDVIRAKCPEAAIHRTVMGGNPSAYARYHYAIHTIELTSLWEDKARKDIIWGGKVIGHEWIHSTQDPAYAITREGEAEAARLGSECV